MIFYSQKDTKVKIGNENVYCSDAAISYSAGVQPKLEVGHKSAFEYNPTSPPKGAIALNYYLTGSDPVAQDFASPGTPISLDVGGLSVSSGYLNKYSIQVQPFAPAKVSASFSFFQKIDGEFTALTSELPTGLPLLVTDLSLDGEIKLSEEEIKSFSYNLSTNLTPVYELKDVIDYDGAAAVSVTSGPTKIDLSFSLYDYNMSLPITGQKESFKINFKNKNGISKQSYEVNGFINSKKLTAAAGSYASAEYSLVQGRLGGASPSVLSITINNDSAEALDIATGQSMSIDGNNFINLDKVLIGEFPCPVESYTSTGIEARASLDMLSGYIAPIRIITHAGETVGTDPITVKTGINFF